MSVRAGWRRARASSIAIALLVGITGGFVVAAASAARVVDAAYQSLLADIDAPDLIVVPSCGDPRSITGCARPPQGEAETLDRLARLDALAQLATLDAVEQARTAEVVRPYLLSTDGEVVLATADNPTGCFDGDRSLAVLALADGGPADQAVPFRLIGALPAPRSNEVLLTRATARRVGLSTGDEVVLAGSCTGDGDVVEHDSPITLSVSGVSIGPLDIEPPGSGLSVEPTYVGGDVLDALLAAGAESSLNSVVWLDENSTEAASRSIDGYDVLLDLEEQADNIDRGLDNDARPLWIMAIAGLVIGLLVLAPIIHRSVTSHSGDVNALASLGAGRGQRGVNAAAHLVVACLGGLLLAAVVAPLIQPRLPLGLGTSILSDRTPGSALIATAVGALVLGVALAGIVAVSTWRVVQPDRSQAHTMTDRRTMSAVRLRPARQTGVMAAVGRPVGRRLANPWPGLVSLALAVAVSIAGLTYVASLRHLEQTPRLTGWNWDMAVDVEGDSAARAATMTELAGLPDVDVLTQGTMSPPVFLSIPDTDLQVWPWSFDTGPGALTPPIVAGRAPEGPDEIAIDEVFAGFTGHGVGDVVVLSRPSLAEQIAPGFSHSGIAFEAPPTALLLESFEITGIAVLSTDRTAEFAQASFTLDGLGDFFAPSDDEIAAARAWLPADLSDDVREEVDGFLSDDFSLDDRVAYIRVTHDRETAVQRISEIEGVSEVRAPGPMEVLTLLNGLNVADNDRVPTALALMGLLAAGALGIYLLVTAMWARRSELAVLRALGLSGSNLRSSFAAQAITTVAMVLVVAVPVGVFAGQWAWTKYASDLDIVEEPVVPTPALAMGTIVALAIGVIVATLVGWLVVRRSAAEQLRAE